MRTTKRSLVSSAVALLLCFSMLLGSTFAWFTDSAISGGNIVQSGSLDVEMYWSETLLAADSNEWKNADGVPVFTYDNWEPGYTDIKYVKIKNAGNLALQWRLSIAAEGKVSELADVIDVYYINPVSETVSTLDDKSSIGVLCDVINTHKYTSGILLPEGKTSAEYKAGETILAIAFHMQEEADNEYKGKTIGDGFSLSLMATQFSWENDAFNKDYDKNPEWPNNVIVGGNSATADVVPDAENKVSGAVSLLSKDGKINASVPAGVMLGNGTNKLTLSVKDVANSKANITLDQTEAAMSIDVHIDGVAANNDVVMAIGIKELLPVGLNMGNYRFYHVENGATVEMQLLADGATPVHNNYEYDPATGDVVLHLKSFSEVALVADTENAWEGNFDYSWYTNAVATVAEGEPDYVIANADQLAAFSAIVGGMNGQTKDSFSGKTVKLLADINLGDKESENNPDLIFYPIGYYNSTGSYKKTSGGSVTSSVSSFEGTFDGNGNTIANFYQNTWEMFGDYNSGYSGTPNHYKDAMGLFGYVLNGTIKNLTVSNFSSDGEFTPTGVIAAYASNSTFENIAIKDCNPRVYNTGNGGIVGIGGNDSDPDTYKLTFTNITIDNSNKITALWGSWDVACGGLVGMFRGAGHAHMTNCHVGAQIDVYNDVCGNYQYYWYRYSGMMIGTNKNMITDANAYTVPETDKFHAENCTVHFGDWNDYYYCELVANSLASYTHDHQFSRLTQIQNVSEIQDANGNWTKTGNFILMNGKTPTETCYHIVNKDGALVEHKHADAGEETVNGATVLKENNQRIFLPFNQLFTGYGWGVKHIPVYNGEDYAFEGITILDREVANSVKKFESILEKNELANNTTIKLGDIFCFIGNGVELVPGALTVSIINKDDSNPVSATIVYDRTNWENSTITFAGAGKVQITIQDYYFCTPTTITVNVTDRQPEEKFDVVMNNGDFLHRVGNQNTVSIGSLFKAKDGVTVGTISVTVEAVNGTGASGTYSNNAIQFSGTGVVKVTITDNDYCIPTELSLEVVDAVNATTATSAKANNVVLLNDVGISTLEVSGGYTLYGNGFKMTATNDVMYDAMGVGFVTLKNGTLDNVQIICPNFSYAIVYTNQIKNDENTAVPSDSSNEARGNVRSAVIVDGNSKIVNSYIHGGRAAIFHRSGNLVVDGSTISGGAAANIHTVSATSLTLRNATLIQKPFQANVHDTSKTIMGFSVLLECGDDGNATPVILEGTLVQDAWINEEYKQYVPSAGTSLVSTALGKTEYLHDIDGDGTNESLNIGFTYIPQNSGGLTIANVTDNRTNKSTVLYAAVDVGNALPSAKVYSYKNTNGTSDGFKNVGDYVPTAQGATAPTVSFTDTNADRVFGTSFDSISDNRWESTLTVNLDNGNYTFSWDKFLVQKHGANLNYTVATKDGTAVNTSNAITLTASGVTDYIITVTDGGVTHTIYFTLTATKTSIPEPEVADTTGGTPLLVVKSKNSDWSCAIPALEGIKIKYYTSANNSVVLDLATLTPTSTGKQNDTNNYWEIAKDGYSLKVTCGYIHDTKQVYGMPVVVNNSGNKMYFTISSTTGYVSTSTSGRTVTLTYEFTDPNGKTLTFSKTWQFNYAEYKNGTQYSYNDFVNGTLKEAGSGTCITPDTLITLADGTQVRVDSLTGNEELLVWNHETGKLDKAPVAYIVNHNGVVSEREIISLTFANGKTVKMIGEHVFFDATLNKYVALDSENADSFIGHNFAALGADGESIENVALVSVDRKVEETLTYEVVSYKHLTCFTEGILSTSAYLDPLLNTFDIDSESLAYDAESVQNDIETYGLYTYADFEGLISEEAFELYNAAYLKIAIGKGYITWDDVLEMIDIYFNVGVTPLAE